MYHNYDKYVYNLVLNNEVREAINQIKFFDTDNKVNNFQILEKWIELGYKIQVDCGSILGTFGDEAKKT